MGRAAPQLRAQLWTPALNCWRQPRQKGESKVRLIKMFGLAALAAVAAMAFMGASSASATSTVLCKENVLNCPAAQQYTGHIEGLAVNPKLTTSLGTVECEHSVILGDALGLSGLHETGGTHVWLPQVTHIKEKKDISFTGNCHVGATPCDIETQKTGLLLLLKTGVNVGTLESHDNEVLVNCGIVIHCVYGGLISTNALGSTATTLGEVHANTTVQALSGLLCPAQATWNALYKIVLPHVLYIAR